MPRSKNGPLVLLWIALRMLTGDRIKFFGLLFGIGFSTLLITQQLVLFVNLIERGASGVYNNASGEVYVMDPVSRTTDVIFPLPSTALDQVRRSEEHTSELQSLMRISYAVFCLKT